MLVRVWKSLVLEGTTTVEKGIIRKRLVKEKIYVSRGISALVCDESEVEEKLAQAIEDLKANTRSWGINFEGWKICKDREILEKKYPFEDDEWLDRVTSDIPVIEYISEYPMEKVIKILNGVQFAQYCKENKLDEIIKIVIDK